MVTFIKTALADAGIIIITFLLFTIVISRDIRHKIWEKYISSFAKFVVYIFIATVVINIVTALIVYKIRYERYMNIIAPSVQSVLIGFVASCVPRRGFEDKKQEELR